MSLNITHNTFSAKLYIMYLVYLFWGNVVKFVILHSLALYGLTLLPSISLPSWVFLFLTYQFSGAGITAGAHRLWAHRAYKV